MKRSHLQSILTAAIVDYCQNNDLYIAELHIQGTVCISSDGAPTLITQLSEKVSTNNNRWVLVTQHQRKSPEEEAALGPPPPPHRKSVVEEPQVQHVHDHRLEGDNHTLTRYEQAVGSESALHKYRRKSEPGYRHHPRYSNEFHRDVQNFRWSVDSIPETVSSKYASDESHPKDLSPERRSSYHHSDASANTADYLYKTPKEEPVELQGHHKPLPPQQHPEGAHSERALKALTALHAETLASGSFITPHEEAAGRAEVPDLWREQRVQAVSAAALAVYNYMHSPTYHTAADSLHSATTLSASHHEHLLRSAQKESRDGGGDDASDGDERVHAGSSQAGRQQLHIPLSSSSLAASSGGSISSTTLSGNHLASPPPPQPLPPRSSPQSIHPSGGRSPGIGPSHPSTSVSATATATSPIHHHHHHHHPLTHHPHSHLHNARGTPYPGANAFQKSRDLPLDYASAAIKCEADMREELHVVTRHLSGGHVPSMVSPSAQAAASAMAALSSLQASIMPSCPPPQPQLQPAKSNRTSPASTASSHSKGELGVDSPAPGDPERSPPTTTTPPLLPPRPPPRPTPPPPPAESPPVRLDRVGCGMVVTPGGGSVQIPDTPVNSHFRKMMLKSLQGKYKVLKTAEGRYKCPVCGVSYVYQPNLRKHLEKVHLGKSYKCEFCGQKFTSVQGYSFHRKVKHRDLMPYRCELCRDAFYSYTAFLQHKKRSHSNHPDCVAITHSENLSLQKARRLMESDND